MRSARIPIGNPVLTPAFEQRRYLNSDESISLKFNRRRKKDVIFEVNVFVQIFLKVFQTGV